jgi:hypothetical protein
VLAARSDAGGRSPQPAGKRKPKGTPQDDQPSLA